jgi:predicted hydrocarbon binding protein
MSEDKAAEKETEVKKAEEVKAEEKKAETKGAGDSMSVEERKAAKLESDKRDADKYHYPNKWARIVLTSAEEVMGPQGVRSMLNMAKIPQYIDNYPPDNMKKEFSFGGVGQLQQAIWDMYGPRGARVFAVRAGEQSFQVGLSQFKSVANAAQVAMRVGSLEAKVKLGLEFFSKLFNTVTDQVVEVSEDDKHWIWKITHCPVCWGRASDEPVCYLAIGVLQAGLSWVTEGKKFRIKETECKAMGHKDCLFMIEKVPVE